MGLLVQQKRAETTKAENRNIENVTLYNEDCLDVFKNLPDESVDLVVTDCPYHIIGGGCTNDAVKIGRYTEPSGIFNRRAEKVKKDSHGNVYNSDSKHVSLCGILDDYDPTTYAKNGTLFKHNDIKFRDWLPKIYRVLKNDTHCYIMINARNLKDLWDCAEKCGFEFQQLLVWDKGNATPNKYYLNAYELILMLRKGKAKNINNMGTKNILKVPNITHVKEHPTEKPARLMKTLIENSSEVGDVVLDPFMGVGGTGVACRKLGRKFIGIEIDERYFNVAQERIGGA